MIDVLAGVAALVALPFLIGRMTGMVGQDVRRAGRAIRGKHPDDEPHTRGTAFWTILPYVARTPTRMIALTIAGIAVASAGATDEQAEFVGAMEGIQTAGGVCVLWALLGYRHFFYGRAVMNRYAEAVELRERRRLDEV